MVNMNRKKENIGVIIFRKHQYNNTIISVFVLGLKPVVYKIKIVK